MAIVYGDTAVTGTCGGCGAPNTATVAVSGMPGEHGEVTATGNCGGCGTTMSFSGYAQLDGHEETSDVDEFAGWPSRLDDGFAVTSGDDDLPDQGYDQGDSSRSRLLLFVFGLIVLVMVVITHISQLRP